jgi:hypothetical protein
MYQRLAGPRLGWGNVDQTQCIVAAAASPCMASSGTSEDSRARRWSGAPLGFCPGRFREARHEDQSDLSMLVMLASQSRIT